MNPQIKTAQASTQYFKVLADGTRVPDSDARTDHVAVLDTTRNLLIYVHSVGINGKAASGHKLKKLDMVGKIDALGGGWRLAELDEAESILDRDRYSPALDPNLFPGIKSAWHLTAKPAAWAPASAAWWVGMYGGGVDDGVLVGVGWALAVRSAGQ